MRALCNEFRGNEKGHEGESHGEGTLGLQGSEPLRSGGREHQTHNASY